MSKNEAEPVHYAMQQIPSCLVALFFVHLEFACLFNTRVKAMILCKRFAVCSPNTVIVIDGFMVGPSELGPITAAPTPTAAGPMAAEGPLAEGPVPAVAPTGSVTPPTTPGATAGTPPGTPAAPKKSGNAAMAMPFAAAAGAAAFGALLI